MKITKESLLKIKSAISDKRKLDLSIYETIIEILRKDTLFNNPINYEKNVGNAYAAINMKTGIFHFSDNVIEYAKGFYKDYSFLPQYNEIDAFNYKLLFTLLHELAHLKQFDYAKNDEGILGKIYRETLLNGNRDEEHYNNNPYDYVFEYNADMEAMKIINNIYAENIFLTSLNYLEFMGLIFNCYFDGEANCFLAQKTFRLFKIDDSDVKKIYNEPINILIHHGLPVNEKILDELYDPMNIMKLRRKYDL